jgi:hypothetical protein
MLLVFWLVQHFLFCIFYSVIPSVFWNRLFWKPVLSFLEVPVFSSFRPHRRHLLVQDPGGKNTINFQVNALFTYFFCFCSLHNGIFFVKCDCKNM